MADEIIFRTVKPRNRLMLELMARAGMRIGEVLKLRPKDIEDRKAIIRAPKSGKEAEAAFLPQKVADRLHKYIADKVQKAEDKIFPITYAAARIVVKKAGDLVGIHPWPRPLTPNLRQYRPIVPKRKYYQIRATSHQGGLKPHDLRRHAATYASRSGTPLEIVSKVLLRHASLSTTQIYLGKISDAEAIRWIDNLHG